MPRRSRNSGWIEVICGPMFSGKTEELLRRCNLVLIADQILQVFKPTLDDRYGISVVQSHNGRSVSAVAVRDARELLIQVQNTTQVVAIDEAQFLDEKLVDVCLMLIAAGKRVIVAGLDMDFKRDPFGPMPFLLARALEVTKLRAICDVCKSQEAVYTQRLIDDRPASINSPVIQVGGRESYQARCRRCHVVPRNENQLKL